MLATRLMCGEGFVGLHSKKDGNLEPKLRIEKKTCATSRFSKQSDPNITKYTFSAD